MKLWILRPVNFSDPDADYPEPWRHGAWDCALGFVIRAKTEQKAREIAQSDTGAETYPNDTTPWLDSSLSTCEPLSTVGPEEQIMRDYNAG